MKNKHLNFLCHDFRGEIWFICAKIFKIQHTAITTMLTKVLLTIGGTKYGKNLSCRGILQVSRAQCSTIVIGNNCKFNSSSLYNQRGIDHRCIISTGKEKARIIIGDRCGFSGVSVVADKEVIIGNDVTIGVGVRIGDRDDHEELYETNAKPVHIGNHVWLGMNVTVMKGVTIGDNSIVGAGAIVTKDIPSGVVAAGIPAKVIKILN